MAQMHIEVLAAIAFSLSGLMALAWMIQQRTGNSGWVDTIWTCSVGLVGAVAAIWPLDGDLPARKALAAGLVLLWSARLGTHIAVRSFRGIDDPRYASYAQEWGAAAARRMLGFLQAQALVAIPLAFSIFLAAHVPQPGLRIQDYAGAAIAFAASWRSRCGRAIAAIQGECQQCRGYLQRRPLALVAPSELFLRVELLVRLSRYCAVIGVSMGVGEPCSPRHYVLDPRPCERDSTP
jgi:hypothetical protein